MLPFFSFLLIFSSPFIGYLLGKATSEELRQGQPYFFWIRILTLISLMLTFFAANLSILPFFLGILLGFILRRLFLYFGMSINSTLPTPVFFSITILTFLYGLVNGTTTTKKRSLFLNAIFFLLGSLLSILSTSFISIAAGALTITLLRELTHALPHRPWHRQRTRSHYSKP